MQKLTLLSVTFVLAGLLACKDENLSTTNSIGRDEPFELHASESASLIDSQIGLEVLEISDSRCPAGVHCIWMGQALVKIQVVAGELLIQETTLCIGDCSQPELSNMVSFSHQEQEYILQLKEVLPYPDTQEEEVQPTATLEWI